MYHTHSLFGKDIGIPGMISAYPKGENLCRFIIEKGKG